MKTISSKVDYPNMTCEEIVASGISLSGDALELFMKNAVDDVAKRVLELERSIEIAVNSISNSVHLLEVDL